MTRSGIHKLIFKVHLFLFVMVIAVSISCRKRAAVVPEITTSTAQIISDYKENEQAADEKYEGKTVLITSKIVHFAVIRETIGVNLKIPDETNEWSLMCLIDKTDNPNAYTRLQRGNDASFVGISKRVSGSFIHFTDCRFAE